MSSHGRKRDEGSLSLPLLIGLPILLDQGLTLTNSFNLSYFLKSLSPNTVTLRTGIQFYEFCGGTVQSIASMFLISRIIRIGREDKQRQGRERNFSGCEDINIGVLVFQFLNGPPLSLWPRVLLLQTTIN